MLRSPCPYLVLVVNQIGTRLSENPRFFVLYSSAPPRLVSVHVLAAGHRVVVGGAEISGRCCYWLVCPLGEQGLVKRICEAFPHLRKKWPSHCLVRFLTSLVSAPLPNGIGTLKLYNSCKIYDLYRT